ncbi:MAG TPA: hypothetical protein VFS79_05140 [Arthrobacter sp.]|nr:hypothetical protein [Arthrobacter sp.]
MHRRFPISRVAFIEGIPHAESARRDQYFEPGRGTANPKFFESWADGNWVSGTLTAGRAAPF